MSERFAESQENRKRTSWDKRRYKDKIRTLLEDTNDVDPTRTKLIEVAFNRIEEGMENGNYLEVICMCDSLMTDRLQRLLEELMKEYEEDYPIGTLGQTIKSLQYELEKSNRIWKLEKSNRTDGWDFHEHLEELADEKPNLNARDPKRMMEFEKSNWVSMRNVALHEFVTLHSLSHQRTIKQRIEWERQTAKDGIDLTNSTFNMVKYILNKLKDDKNWGKTRR